MGQNRIEGLLRDPSLEQPAPDYHEVRLRLRSFAVRREVAERLMEAILRPDGPEWIRVETVTGSVIFLRIGEVVYVREWTEAQRASERRFWKMIEDEDEDEDEWKDND